MWGTWKQQGRSQGRFSLATNALNHLFVFFFFHAFFFQEKKGLRWGEL